MKEQPTQHHIRYYDKFIHTDQLRLIGGWRVVLIIALNWLRYWVETLVQRLTLSVLLEREGVKKEHRSKFVEVFWGDVRRERAIFEDTGRRVTTAAEGQKPEVLPTVDEPLVVDRGSPVTFAVSKQKEPPLRPQPLDEMVAKYDPNSRSGKYGLNNVRLVVEGFEAVTPSQEKK
jgi:hypothetical protein